MGKPILENPLAVKMGESSINPFRKLIWDLSLELKKEDVNGIIYLAELGDGVAEACKYNKDVLEQLRRSGKIGPDNLVFLRKLIQSVKRSDLLNLIGELHNLLVSLNCLE